MISENSSSSVVVVDDVDGSLFEVAKREECAIDFDFIGCENDDARLILPAEAGDDDGSLLRAMMAVPSLSILVAVMAA